MSLLDSLLRRKANPGAAPQRSKQEAAQAAELAKNQGNQHFTKGELDLAAECYREAVRLNPEYAEAYNNLGLVLIQQKRYGEADAVLDIALSLNAGLAQAHLNRGKAAFATRNFEQAESCFRRALQDRPDDPDYHVSLGDALFELERFEEAIAAYQTALALNPDLPQARLNLASAYYKGGRKEEAEELYRVALDQYGQATAAYYLGVICETRYDSVAAIPFYRRAIELDPGYVQPYWNLALSLLLNGEYSDEAWRCFEKRVDTWNVEDETIHMGDIQKYIPAFGLEKWWSGGDVHGKRLLVWSEQGLGDALMFMRYLPALKARGAKELTVYVARPLQRIMEAIPGVDRVIVKTLDSEIPRESFDLHVSMMSLAARFNARLDGIGGASPPYLEAPDESVRHWAAKLAQLPGCKVGLVWGGSKDMAADARRSLPLEAFAPLMDVPGIAWISLQKGEPAEQLKALGWPITDWMNECKDLMDTAALIANLDLVICVDTGVAHLSGALAKPVWLLNRYESEWRWMRDREDSPWYPSLRVFRQEKPGEWAPVIDRIRMGLQERVRQ